MQTILGSNGAIGQELAKSLINYTSDIRLVSRNPKKINATDQLMKADLTQRDAVFNAIEGSKIAYLCVGLKYDIKVWQKDWPVLMRNVLDACHKYNCKLVFIDNVYAIDPAHIGHITEESPMNPVSKKGLVRKEINEMILGGIQNGKVQAIIARCADYFGPYPELSLVMISTYSNFIKGKKAQWMGNPKMPHTYTYTADAGKGLAILGNTPGAYNQIWNLPTEKRGFTGEDWVNLVSKEMGKSNKYSTLGNGMMGFLSLFVPILRELKEMAYQFNSPYYLDSSKFEKSFNIKATPYEEAMHNSIVSLTANNHQV